MPGVWFVDLQIDVFGFDPCLLSLPYFPQSSHDLLLVFEYSLAMKVL
jgi:hypothetical protein